MKRLLALVLGLSLALMAYGHTKLASTSPAADAAVVAPRVIELTFAGDVRLTSVSLTDATGAAKHLDAVPTAIASRQIARARGGGMTRRLIPNMGAESTAPAKRSGSRARWRKATWPPIEWASISQGRGRASPSRWSSTAARSTR